MKQQEQFFDPLFTQNETQTQEHPVSPTYVPKTTLTLNLLSTPQQFYFQPFALYCVPRGKRSQVTTSYQAALQPTVILQTIEEFFEYFLSIKKPSTLEVDYKIMLFYKTCKPFWQEWLNSGCLLIQFRNNKEEEEKLSDVIWEYLCYALVGNNIDHEVIGVIVNKREKMTLIEIWLRTNDRAKQIGVILEDQIKKELPPSVIAEASSVLKVKHKRHIDSINTNSTIKGAQKLTQVHIKRTQLNNSF